MYSVVRDTKNTLDINKTRQIAQEIVKVVFACLWTVFLRNVIIVWKACMVVKKEKQSFSASMTLQEEGTILRD